MFSKRRIILFLIVLAVMLLVKYAASQEIVQVGWDMENCWDCSLSAEVYVSSAMFWGVVGGVILRSFRVCARNHAFQHGGDFEPEIIRLRLS